MSKRTESLEDVLTPEYAGALVRHLTWGTGSAVYDEDLIQEVLLRGVIAMRRRQEITYPRAFFGKIAKDAVSDHWRRRRILAVSIDELSIVSITPIIENEMDRNRQLSRLKQAMQTLSETDRRLIELVYLEDHSLSDLVGVFETSHSALKMKMFRCRQRLRLLMHQ